MCIACEMFWLAAQEPKPAAKRKRKTAAVRKAVACDAPRAKPLKSRPRQSSAARNASGRVRQASERRP